MDLIVGKEHQDAVVTLTERKSRFTLIRKVFSKHSSLVAEAIIEHLGWTQPVESITSDNGKEFAAHQRIAKELATEVYFFHPYSSWECGSNENTNGLIRQYFPKNRNLITGTTQEQLVAMDRLNLRPRKCLDFKTHIRYTLNIILLHLLLQSKTCS